MNNSMKYAIHPDQLKFPLIIPLFKKGGPLDIRNYRPISLLPLFSKNFELVKTTRLLYFMNMSDLFNIFQHRYLKDRSTISAIYNFVSNMLS